MEDPKPRTRRRHPVDKYGPKVYDKSEHMQGRAAAMKAALSGDHPSQSEPAGGFDSTPYPYAPPGYTLKFTFHRGVNLPCADFGTFSSDPYVLAQLIVDLPQRHKQDPVMSFRTPTVRKNRDPEWNSEWIVANVPASGFHLKCHVYDEDAADHDDKLGNAYIDVDSVNGQWPGIKEQNLRLKKRMGSKRVYLFGNIAALASRRLDVQSHIVISVQCLGKTPGDEGAHMYTVGPNYWFKHFSPLIGRIAGTKDEVQSHRNEKKTITRYNFQAIQIQLKGPVPTPLYHRYVEFKPFVAGMFTSHSLRGRILNRALHHQHERIYNFDKTTLNGQFPSPCIELTQKFLEFVHYAQGGRIFTYVITLDGQFRFTETGKEFGIDLLSKHTMHSDVSIYIAYSGEFFLRRLKHRHPRHPETIRHSETRYSGDESLVEPEISIDPADYELFIDNDSGTYRPNGQYLPLLKEFISANLPGLHVTTLDCKEDAERMAALKNEQREFKKNEGNHMIFLQRSNSSSLSISSSDEDELNERGDLQPQKKDGFAQKVHDMRDLKGQMMKWAQPDNHGSPDDTESRSGRQRTAAAHSSEASKPAVENGVDESTATFAADGRM
ncbi:C2 domain protein [Aspergillus eucalypticola CBS 122712]|uniref:C2 domain protein n=1 Tax=Aspergillus eucalypticola (strain CBS 122712 / IBT 29274) TaxID=1448314 RepID=A0A317V091_ASPEC|nr:C2 domain protein [Aspergillus eucalypticola CBS 122712]PWY67673.1 C2 domain protein [Aspergillus eucalypticola CBS 122712]